MGLQKSVLKVPQLLGQVHIVVVGVFKALDFLPLKVQLVGAAGTDVLQRGEVVDQFAVLEDGF